jgi:hypothetical protein
MKIHWANLWEGIGIAYGYSNHQKKLLEAIERQGIEIDRDADVAVHLTTPATFQPTEGKLNFLYTMYEMNDLPPDYVECLDKADVIVVPCKHNKTVFQKYTDRPIEVCWEGVDTDIYTYTEREFPQNRPFTFLWFGASNPRKGTEYMMGAWEVWNRMYPELRNKTMLIMKTTQNGDNYFNASVVQQEVDGKLDWVADKKVQMPQERIVRCGGNAIVDTRKMPEVVDGPMQNPPGSLQQIYHFAHAFILPTRGEGFGLTLAEAAATGLPCVYTPFSGPRDFMSEKIGYPIKWTMGKANTVNPQDGSTLFESTAATPDIESIVRRMYQIYSNYNRALAKGRKAAEHMRKGFTWDISAQSLIRIIQKYTEEKWETQKSA